MAAAQEADASDAAQRYAHHIVRGPLFGVAPQEVGDGHRWQVSPRPTDPEPAVRDRELGPCCCRPPTGCWSAPRRAGSRPPRCCRARTRPAGRWCTS
ncbi:DUF5954 family protein [Streptomyces sp. 5.8]|uniref:DUF5954 family protein n=1 Tax=Streptomyces sp. 5.8 TaxID=3406571 RepID=UPI003BB5E513